MKLLLGPQPRHIVVQHFAVKPSEFVCITVEEPPCPDGLRDSATKQIPNPDSLIVPGVPSPSFGFGLPTTFSERFDLLIIELKELPPSYVPHIQRPARNNECTDFELPCQFVKSAGVPSNGLPFRLEPMSRDQKFGRHLIAECLNGDTYRL